jgi:ABC-type transport system substrate-binding protein
MRQAINFALDRQALAAVATPGTQAASGYLPPGMPGYRSDGPYPLRPDLSKARLLAGTKHPRTAVLWANSGGRDRAELVRQALAALGITAHVEVFPAVEFGRRISGKRPAFDIAASGGWDSDYVDPSGMLSLLFDGRLISHGANLGAFDDPAVNRRFDALAKLTGRVRYRLFGQFAFHLARDDAPEIVWGVPRVTELFSSRIGCRVYQPINQGVDLAALCIK